MCATTQATLKYVTGLARGHSLHWVRNIDNVKLHRTRPGHSAAGNEFLCKATPQNISCKACRSVIRIFNASIRSIN
jgi:hypothetical protein